jgi:hypothetical protein
LKLIPKANKLLNLSLALPLTHKYNTTYTLKVEPTTKSMYTNKSFTPPTKNAKGHIIGYIATFIVKSPNNNI